MKPPQEERRSKYKQLLELGIHVDFKWLLTLFVMGILQLGMQWQQFNDMKNSIAEIKKTVGNINRMDETQERQDKTLTDHELRIRQLEQERRSYGRPSR